MDDNNTLPTTDLPVDPVTGLPVQDQNAAPVEPVVEEPMVGDKPAEEVPAEGENQEEVSEDTAAL